MSKNAVGRLSLMMFLQYAVWGAWLPLAARYLSAPSAEGGLGFTGAQIGMILGFTAAIPLRMFGAEIYIASLVGIAVVR